MGQKVHPNGIRLGIVKEHTSVWYADKRTYADYLLADLKVREYLQDKLKSASVSRIDIHRPAQTARITIHTARPGIVIGKKGEDVEKLRQDLTKQMGVPVHINIEDPQAGARRYVGCTKRSSAAGAPRYVPSRHEARSTERHAYWCQGHQDPGKWSSGRC